MKVFKTIVIVVLAILLGIFGYNALLRIPKMKWKDHDYCYIYQHKTECPYTKKELKSIVSELFDTQHFYREIDGGSRVFVPFRSISISKNVFEKAYVQQYAHELAHIKFNSRDEKYIVYKTITTLYESNNEYFKYVAIDYANEFLTKSNADKSYDCGYYLIEYFKENGEL